MCTLEQNRYQLAEQRHQIVCVGCFSVKWTILRSDRLIFNNPHKYERDTSCEYNIFYMCISYDGENITFFHDPIMCTCMCVVFVYTLVKQSKRTWEFLMSLLYIYSRRSQHESFNQFQSFKFTTILGEYQQQHVSLKKSITRHFRHGRSSIR